ncbi:Hsp20/alpha crystallin family protein [Heyndrickxia acidicola]|uniref:Hsp20/alpha crystallin family protein n=1 Tax=Heyndrickxia acidicola TaxID=209389 RepID=A0ABU6MAJ5_9BACI|nr:Hsp20/alpha crystallin family protein [Heyndrickxia acidicola]MED1201545.1 Hsp20/alpha crystallin family protein [Heyndrickxia acidicola]
MFPWNMFPFNKESSNWMGQIKPQDIEKHVQNMLSQVMPDQWQGLFNQDGLMKNASSMFQQQPQGEQQMEDTRGVQQQTIQAAVFETFDDIFVRVPLKEEEWAKQIRIFHTSNQAILENIPSQGERQIITLPCLVKKKGTTAQFRDGILEIKMPKNTDMQYTEVDVSERR